MNKIEVTVRANTYGKLLPLRFTSQGQEFPILGIGRRWQAPDGEHLLVMVPGDRVVELIYQPDQTWASKPVPQQGKRWFV
ncbi:MAG TPA: hypothetical protein DCY42_03270 [Chloroflexi bacterium]|nr:hypothetical protein [Chloroflexota bacterium]